VPRLTDEVRASAWKKGKPWIGGLDAGLGGHPWPAQAIRLHHFNVAEFKHPELMGRDFLLQLDYYRQLLGFALTVNSDARTQQEQERLYAAEIAAGTRWPKFSGHTIVGAEGVGCVDLKPSGPTPERWMMMYSLALEFWRTDVWPFLGLGLESAHLHIDNHPDIPHRPNRWIHISR
jgi:hypothetical protein